MEKLNDRQLYKLMLKYGKDVLYSRYFFDAFYQRHHFKTSVGEHTMQVAAYTIKLCRYFKEKGIEVDEKTAVRAALCHDLGLIGRDEKYKNNMECSKRHPIDSAELAKTIYPGMDDVMRQAILSHMWPVRPLPPKSWEGVAVSLADKIASISDLMPGSKHWKWRWIH